jgi:hypothetical protein
MKAVLLLVWCYFTCTPVLRAFSAIGLALIVVSTVLLGTRAQSDSMLWMAQLGVMSFFIGSTLMPLMFGRLARTHGLRLMPLGRLKLLASAFVTAVLVSAPLALYLVVAFYQAMYHPSPGLDGVGIHGYPVELGWLTWVMSFSVASWLYLALWFITNERRITGYVKGLLVIAVVMLVPARQIHELDAQIGHQVRMAAVSWGVFGAIFLLWPHWRFASARLRAWLHSKTAGLVKQRIAGREIDLLLGTANPWVLAVAQCVPIFIATRIGFYAAEVWLFYLTVFSTVAGAIAGQAAERSRPLWLRGGWSRVELFSQVERSFWRHNSYALGVLIALMLAIGSYSALPPSLLAVGIPLLVLGTVLSTYLGLMITRGLRWLEALLAMSVMVTLMAIAVLAARSLENLPTVVALEALLVAAAIVFRFIARRRWAEIDWMICRPDRALSARAAA